MNEHARRFRADRAEARRYGLKNEDAEDAAQDVALRSLINDHRYSHHNGGFRKTAVYWESMMAHKRNNNRGRREGPNGLAGELFRRFIDSYKEAEYVAEVNDFVAWAKRQVGEKRIEEVLLYYFHMGNGPGKERKGDPWGGIPGESRRRGISRTAWRASVKRTLKKLRSLVPQNDE